MQFQLQVKFQRAGSEKVVKSTTVETFQSLRTQPARDWDGGKTFIASYWEAHIAHAD